MIQARLDKKSIVRCGCPDVAGRQTCRVRFGAIVTISNTGELQVLLDPGWRFRDGAYRLNQYDADRFERALRAGTVAEWRAKRRATSWGKPTVPQGIKVTPGIDSFSDEHGRVPIICPIHGAQHLVPGELVARHVV